MVKEQIGAIPYVKVGKEIKLILVTSRSSGKWIFPKGHPEPDMSKPDVAAMEAFEEAGVFGTVNRGKSKTVTIHRRGGQIKLKLYPLKVMHILRRWPEKSQRERIVVSPHKAAALLGDSTVARIVKQLVKAI